MSMESSPLISVQLKEAFLREVQRALTAEEANLWKSENRDKVCTACLSVQQNQLSGSSPSRCLPETPVPIPAGQPIVVACTPCIQRSVTCSFNLDEGRARVKRVLGIDYDTFASLWKEMWSHPRGQGQDLAQYSQQPHISRLVEAYSVTPTISASASASASTSASTSTSTSATSIFTSPTSISSPYALTISKPNAPAIPHTKDNITAVQQFAKVLENSREASNNLHQLYVAAQAQCDHLRAQLAHTQAQLEVSQRQHEELHRTHQQLATQFEGTTWELLRVRQENQDLLIKDLHRDGIVENLKEREKDLQRTIEQERSERDGVQRQFDTEAASWRNERLALALKLGEKEDEVQRLTLQKASACNTATMLQQKLVKAEEDTRNAKQEAEWRTQTLDAVKTELSAQATEIQRLREALEQTRCEKEEMNASLQKLQDDSAKAAEDSKMAQAEASERSTKIQQLQESVKQAQLGKEAAISQLKDESQSLSSSLSEATIRLERLLQLQTTETANIRQLVKEFADVRAKFSDGKASREDVENTCDRLGMDLVVILSRLEVKARSGYKENEVQNLPKKRKLDAAVT